MTVPLYNLTDTWNNGATVFTAIQMNVTDTASDATSKFLDFQISGTSIFSVDKAGTITALKPGGGQTALIKPANDWSGTVGFRFGLGGAGYTNTIGPTTGFMATVGGGFHIGDQLDSATSTNITSLVKDANFTFAQRSLSGNNAQAFRVYNAYTDPSNYERGGFDWITTANTFRIRSENLGTGTNRIIAIDGFAKAGAAIAGDIPSGTWALVRDTSGATTKLIYNNAGTLMTVALT